MSDAPDDPRYSTCFVCNQAIDMKAGVVIAWADDRTEEGHFDHWFVVGHVDCVRRVAHPDFDLVRHRGSLPPEVNVRTTVESFSKEEGWGALAATEETPGGVFVHFSAIKMEGYQSLRAGQEVEAVVEGPLPFEQDGYRYRAVSVRPLG